MIFINFGIKIKYQLYNAQFYISRYQLEAHPEGGWYKETYKSSEIIETGSLPVRFGGSRVFSTAIYFLLEKGNFSAFHRIKSDECWHFYAGQPLEVFIIQPQGILEIVTLGSDIDNGQVFQYVVPANCWFASRPAAGSEFSFVGCTVAPGFDFADFEMADVKVLQQQYSPYKTIIESLCR